MVTLLILVGVLRPQNGKSNPLVNMPILFQKKKLSSFEKFKELISPLHDFSRPYPYVIMLSGGIIVFLYCSPNFRRNSSESVIAITKNLSDLTAVQFQSFLTFLDNSSKSLQNATSKTISTLESFIKTDHGRIEKMDTHISKVEQKLHNTILHDQETFTSAILNEHSLNQCKNDLVNSLNAYDELSYTYKAYESTLVDVYTSQPNGQFNLPNTHQEFKQKLDTRREQIPDGKNKFIEQVEARYPKTDLPPRLDTYLEQKNPNVKKK